MFQWHHTIRLTHDTGWEAVLKAPEGYELLPNWLYGDKRVRGKDLVFNPITDSWEHPKYRRYFNFGVVNNYWGVARISVPKEELEPK